MVAKKSLEKYLDPKVAGGNSGLGSNSKINTDIKEFDENDLSYSAADISNISHLQKSNNQGKHGNNQQPMGINSSGILGSPYSNILKSAMKNTNNSNSNSNILDQLINSNAGIDFNTKPSSLIFESNVRNFNHKHGTNINHNNMEEDLIDSKTHSNNILGDFLLSSPFYNPNFNNNDFSPSNNNNNNNNSNNHNHSQHINSGGWSHNMDLFKTPLKTPILNLSSNMKSGSSFPMTALKLSIHQQSSANNMISISDINNIHPLLTDNNQSPSIVRSNAKELRREKKRRLKIEVNNEDPVIEIEDINGKLRNENEDLSSEATIDMTTDCFPPEEEQEKEKDNINNNCNNKNKVLKRKRKPIINNNNDTDEEDIEKEYTTTTKFTKKKVSLSPLSKSLKKSGNILPKQNLKRKPFDSMSSNGQNKILPRMGSFSTHSQSRMSSFNNTTLTTGNITTTSNNNNNSTHNQIQHHFTNDSMILGNISNKRNMSILSNSSQTTNSTFHNNNNNNISSSNNSSSSSSSGSIKKPKKKRIANGNSGNNGSNGGKKYQIVLKFPDTFT